MEAELAECALEAASAAERVGVKAASAVESAVGEASEALRDELRRVEAEWERRVAEIETDVEFPAVLPARVVSSLVVKKGSVKRGELVGIGLEPLSIRRARLPPGAVEAVLDHGVERGVDALDPANVGFDGLQ